MKVSLIVPVYNVAPYLEKTIMSIVGQTYKNLEIILVNDGSNDGSEQICNCYANIYKNIIVLNQENKGQSIARNVGVLKASGRYVTFVDADDVISEEYVEYLVGLIKEFDADIAIGNIRKVYTGDEYCFRMKKEERERLNTHEAIQEMCYGKKFGLSPCAKLFKKELIAAHPFPEGKMYEDYFTIPYVIAEATKVAFGNKEIYLYLKREESITTKKLSKKRLQDGSEAAEKLLEYGRNYNLEIELAAISAYVNHFQYYLNGAMDDSKESKRLYQYIKKKIWPLRRKVILNSKERIQTKIEVFVICLGRYPTILFYRILSLKRNIKGK